MEDGWWIAVIVEEAPGPEEKAGMAWERALLSPATGSDLEFVQLFLEGFFFADHVACSTLFMCPALGGCGVTIAVEVDEVDAREEEEFDL